MSCIEHSPRDPFVMLRRDYMELCEGNPCAAMLLSVFEHWTNSRLGNTEERGGDQWIYRSLDELQEDDLIDCFGRDRISEAIKFLTGAGFLERRNNPTLRWDRKLQYRLNSDAVQVGIDGLDTHSRKSEDADRISEDASSGIRGSIVGNPTSNTEDSVRDSEKDPAKAAAEVSPRDRVEVDDPRHTWEWRVFEAWREATEQPSARFTDRRRKAIVRGGSAFDEGELIEAVGAWKLSPYHRGDNNTGRRFNRLEDLLKDDDVIEELLGDARDGARR